MSSQTHTTGQNNTNQANSSKEHEISFFLWGGGGDELGYSIHVILLTMDGNKQRHDKETPLSKCTYLDKHLCVKSRIEVAKKNTVVCFIVV